MRSDTQNGHRVTQENPLIDIYIEEPITVHFSMNRILHMINNQNCLAQ